MSELLWVKMPSKWISNKVLADRFSSNNISTEIAALKLYIGLCLFSNVVTRTKIRVTVDNRYFDVDQTPRFDYPDLVKQAESTLTYDQLGDSCSLSRSLIKRGLDKLKQESLIRKEGTTRKKVYVLEGGIARGWCKLPKKELLKKDIEISAFKAFTQRYEHERDALKIFLYILSIRSNSKRFVDVSRGKISEVTGVKLGDIYGALGFLRSIGLLDDVKSRGHLKSAVDTCSFCESTRLHRYWVSGCASLNLRRVTVESEDYEGLL